MTDYQVEAKTILKDLFYEKWMSESDYEQFLSEVFKVTNLSLTKLAEQLKTGVENGHSIETQKEILKNLFSK